MDMQYVVICRTAEGYKLHYRPYDSFDNTNNKSPTLHPGEFLN